MHVRMIQNQQVKQSLLRLRLISLNIAVTMFQELLLVSGRQRFFMELVLRVTICTLSQMT